jgi:hypothetical protein
MVPIKQKVGTLPAWSVPAREHRVQGWISDDGSPAATDYRQAPAGVARG